MAPGMRFRPVGGADTFGPDEYLAFVESVEPFERAVFEGPPGERRVEPPEWNLAIDLRPRLDLEPPTHVAVLDCVRAAYFVSLPWREERCPLNVRRAAERRRSQIATLDPAQFLVVIAFIDARSPDEGPLLEELAEGAWRFLRLTDDETGLPVLRQDDFEWEEGRDGVRYMSETGRCDEPLWASLNEVFSLNFVPDIDLGGDQEPPWMRPMRPSPLDPFGVEYEQPLRPIHTAGTSGPGGAWR